MKCKHEKREDWLICVTDNLAEHPFWCLLLTEPERKLYAKRLAAIGKPYQMINLYRASFPTLDLDKYIEAHTHHTPNIDLQEKCAHCKTARGCHAIKNEACPVTDQLFQTVFKPSSHKKK